jgi:hypothetical protein
MSATDTNGARMDDRTVCDLTFYEAWAEHSKHPEYVKETWGRVEEQAKDYDPRPLLDWIATVQDINSAMDAALCSDPVNHPQHYGGVASTYEAIKVIEAWGLDFCLGNTVKYISRAGKKDPTREIEDLEKAAWYLNRRIEQLRRST